MRVRIVDESEAAALRASVAASSKQPAKSREERAAERAAQREAERQAHIERVCLGEEDHYHAVICDAWGNDLLDRPYIDRQDAWRHLQRWMAEYRSKNLAVEVGEDSMRLWQRFTQRVMTRNRMVTQFENVVQTGRIVADRCERSLDLNVG